ncbi:MAG TPA: hypothetical protein VGK17_23215 [Propionicimonas sp.]
MATSRPCGSEAILAAAVVGERRTLRLGRAMTSTVCAQVIGCSIASTAFQAPERCGTRKGGSQQSPATPQSAPYELRRRRSRASQP